MVGRGNVWSGKWLVGQTVDHYVWSGKKLIGQFITVGKMVGPGIGNRSKIQFITYRSKSKSGKWLIGE